MGQYDYTGTTGASNYSGEGNEYRNGSNRDRTGSSYQSGYRGDNRTSANRWSQDEGGDYTAGGRYDSGSTNGNRYGSDDYRDGLAIDETRTLIASSKVEGTAVYDRDGSRMGTIHNFMVNKRSGRVDYAVLSFGGFLGMGTRYYPLPWDMLEYDTSQGGYAVDMDEDDLEEAPSFRSGEEPDFSDRYGEYVYGYYGMRY